MNKFLFSIAALSVVGVGSAQAPGTHPNLPEIGAKAYYDYGPNIKVPYTNTLHLGDPVTKATTNYLIYTGPSRNGNLPEADVATHGPFAHTHFQNGVGYQPKDVAPAYGLALPTSPTAGGQDAIAIVDAYHSIHTLSDFNTFSSQFGLPTESSTVENNVNNKVLSIVYAGGSVPPEDTGWAAEMALDVEWAHSMAPKAKLYLVLANSSSSTDLYAAVQYATSIPGVKQVIREVSMSWGAAEEFAGENSFDSYFNSPTQGAVYFAATGDTAGNKGYPGMSPYVVAVGGTTINITNSTFQTETVWADAGAGPSTFVPIPAFQSSNPAISKLVGSFRNSPDIVGIADPNTGVAIYETYNGGWFDVGGTSLACPLSAAIHNVRGQYLKPTGGLTGTQLELKRQYSRESVSNFPNSNLIRDVVSGSITVAGSSPAVTYTTGPGYDIASGLGETVGLYPPSYTGIFDGKPIQTGSTKAAYGTYLNGSLNSAGTYNIQSTNVSGTGQVAGTEIDFTLGIPAKYTLLSAELTLGTKSVSGSTGQLYFYNWVTQTWDYSEAYPMFGSTVTNSYYLNLTNYVGPNNLVRVLTRSVLPTRIGTGTYIYGISTATVTALANANSD